MCDSWVGCGTRTPSPFAHRGPWLYFYVAILTMALYLLWLYNLPRPMDVSACIPEPSSLETKMKLVSHLPMPRYEVRIREAGMCRAYAQYCPARLRCVQ